MSLHPTLSGLAIPSFALGRWFQFWEIPIFVALLLFGLKYAVTIAALDTIAVMIIFRGGVFTSWFNIIPFTGTMLGVYLIKRRFAKENYRLSKSSKRKETAFAVAAGISLRYLIGYPVFYLILKYLLQFPDPAIITITILHSIHDLILVGYSVPISYLITEIIRKHLRIGITTNSQSTTS